MGANEAMKTMAQMGSGTTANGGVLDIGPNPRRVAIILSNLPTRTTYVRIGTISVSTAAGIVMNDGAPHLQLSIRDMGTCIRDNIRLSDFAGSNGLKYVWCEIIEAP